MKAAEGLSSADYQGASLLLTALKRVRRAPMSSSVVRDMMSQINVWPSVTVDREPCVLCVVTVDTILLDRGAAVRDGCAQ